MLQNPQQNSANQTQQHIALDVAQQVRVPALQVRGSEFKSPELTERSQARHWWAVHAQWVVPDSCTYRHHYLDSVGYLKKEDMKLREGCAGEIREKRKRAWGD